MALTNAQSDAISAYLEAGSYRGAAKKLGKAETTIREMLKRLERLGQVPWQSPAEIPAH